MSSPRQRDAAPLGPDDAAATSVRVADPAFVDGALHWLQSAADGSGRMVLMAASSNGPPTEVSPPGASLRSRLYGYGAASWCPTPHGPVGVDAATQALVPLAPSGVPAGSIEPGASLGDPAPVATTTWVVAACEDAAARRGLVALDVATGAWTWLHAVAGRCGEPRVRPDGRAIAWLAWPHGAMPWDAAEVWAASLEVGRGAIACRRPRRVDGGTGAAAGQPTWRSDGSLAYVSEAAGWSQPWVCDDGGAVRRLCARRAEFQRPRWLTCRWLAALDDRALACGLADRDGEHVAVLEDAGGLAQLVQPCLRVDGVAGDGAALGWVGATFDAQGVACVAARGPGPVRVVASGPRAAGAPEPSLLALDAQGVALDAVCWRPPGAEGPLPLVVTVHPGPTGAVDRSYDPLVHLLTARGYAVASLDHSGSTAHGRAHRDRLAGRYGELDVAECAAMVRHLVATGAADPGACFARGTSAGGTTALLLLGDGVLRGAVAWYPASRFEDDEEGFEAGYLTALAGPRAEERSPLARAPHLRGRALLVQGADDAIVPPATTDALRRALARSLDEVSLVTIDGEGHGFRTREGRTAALRAELEFYARATMAAAGERDRYDAGTSGTPAPDATR